MITKSHLSSLQFAASGDACLILTSEGTLEIGSGLSIEAATRKAAKFLAKEYGFAITSEIQRLKAALVAEVEVNSAKPSRIGIIGHVDHGKTSLTAAIVRLAQTERAPSSIVDEAMVKRAEVAYWHEVHHGAGYGEEAWRAALVAALGTDGGAL